MLEFCDMLEYLHPCSTISRALRCELIVVSNCLTPDSNCHLMTSCSKTVRLFTFSATAVVLARAFCLVCCRALAFLSAVSFAACLICGFFCCNRPVVSVLLLLKRFLDGLRLVFHLGSFLFLSGIPCHLLCRCDLATI